MNFELEHFRTKFGQRIVGLFFLCALIPTTTLAVVSYVRVRAELRDQTQERLHQGTTDAAMGVFERVQAIESEMSFLSASKSALAFDSRDEGEAPVRAEVLRRLSEVSLARGDRSPPVPLVGSLTELPQLSPDQQARANEGRTVLTVVPPDEGKGLRILMARPLDGEDAEAGVLWARIISDSLWSTARVYGTNISADEVNNQDERGFCVLDPQMRPLDCVGNLASWMTAGPPEGILIPDDSLHGATSWINDGRRYSGHYRRVHLRDFSSENWTIVVGESEESNQATLRDFRRNLIGILVLTMAIVLLLAAVQIRRSMEPLAKLRAGTRRIASKDFSTRVHIASGDEFEELAGSFNEMARQVGTLFDELEDLSWSTITTLARTIDAKSHWTAGHSERVAAMAVEIARTLGLPKDELERLYRGGLLHDIGKIGIPMRLIDKQGRLTDEEKDIMESHVAIGARILEPLKPLADVVPLVLYHHERIDGLGYPEGLVGTEIPYLARILSVADTFDALRSDRPYRAAASVEEGIRVVVAHSGTQLDSEVIEAFVEVMKSGDGSMPIMPTMMTRSGAAVGFGSAL